MKQAEVSVISSYPVIRVKLENAVRSVRKIRLATKRRATALITVEYLVLVKSQGYSNLPLVLQTKIRLARCLSNTR